MERIGKEHHIMPRTPMAPIMSISSGHNSLTEQRSEGLVTLGVGPGLHEWVALTPDEARQLAKWLLKDANKAEAYTPDA